MKKVILFLAMLLTGSSAFAFKPADMLGTWEVNGSTEAGPYVITLTIKDNGYGLLHYYNKYNNNEPRLANYFLFSTGDRIDVYVNDRDYGVIIEESKNVFKWYNNINEYRWGKEGAKMKKLSSSLLIKDYNFRK